jgi:hypothetical protein
MTSILVAPHDHDETQVRAVLDAAGPRGASHEDFVEAGLARTYIAVLRRLVDERGVDIRVDFTTGTARWALRSESPLARQAA